jgi:UMF1 family MFS transporter
VIATTTPTRPRGVRGIVSWCLFDWANSAFNTIIETFVFSVYFARVVYGDETAGSAAFAYTIGAAGIAVAVMSPAIGAISDTLGRRKPWLGFFLVMTLIPTALLWFAYPSRDSIGFTLACVFIAFVAFEFTNVFSNAMLTTVAPPHALGRVSGWAWGAGYAGGLASLVVVLVGFVLPEEPWFGLSKETAEHLRATGPLTALWFGLFALPLFLFVADEPAVGLSAGQAVRRGFANLWRTLREIRKYSQIVRFLIASALYRDGLTTLFTVGGLFAAGTFKMSFQEILYFAIGLNVTAGIGCTFFAVFDDRLGSRPTTLIALAGLVVSGTAVLLAPDSTTFIALSLVLGIFVGPAQAASRTLMARLAPPEKRAEMFGLYSLSGKSIAFLGPLAFAALTNLSGNQRVGMTAVIIFIVLGAVILLGVREPARVRRAD